MFCFSWPKLTRLLCSVWEMAMQLTCHTLMIYSDCCLLVAISISCFGFNESILVLIVTACCWWCLLVAISIFFCLGFDESILVLILNDCCCCCCYFCFNTLSESANANS